MNEDLSIVILAAGLGTRMKSQTAKVLHEAGGMTLVEHVVKSSLALTDPDHVVVVVGHQAARVKQVLAPAGVRFAVQSEQKGTGHALMMCRETVRSRSGLLIVLYGDCPLLSERTLRMLVDHHVNSGASGTVIAAVLDDPTGYGRVVTNGKGDVEAIVEQKAASPAQLTIKTINSGIYCIDAEKLWKHIGEITPNPASQELYLTDIVEIFNRAGLRFTALVHPDANELLGINTRVELADADRIFRTRKARDLMLGGVTIEKPESVTIDEQVAIGQDTIIEAFAQIRGNSTIGENCRIGSGAIIRDSKLADGVEIAPYTIVNRSVVETGASIGPFARLRQDNHVGTGAHIGNFVELKKVNFGAGTKAGHLAYLGDAEIGAGTNVGAGTITCNYDGAKKHKTIIGPNAFIGSNGTLVAPVQVGEGAYVGAGSVITDNVPDDALAIGRGRQVVKDEWAKKRRQNVQK